MEELVSVDLRTTSNGGGHSSCKAASMARDAWRDATSERGSRLGLASERRRTIRATEPSSETARLSEPTLAVRPNHDWSTTRGGAARLMTSAAMRRASAWSVALGGALPAGSAASRLNLEMQLWPASAQARALEESRA